MKIVFISDTHAKHRQLTLPEGDILIHAGDVSERGEPEQIDDFLNWISIQDFRHKIFIAGNHDFYFEDVASIQLDFIIPDNVIYLNDSGVTIEGIKIWGSPVQPWFYDWAFNRQRGEEIQQHWDLIPNDTDILITHGPPKGVLDMTKGGIEAGCENLYDTVMRTTIKVHVFGHIHEGYGMRDLNNKTFINASSVDYHYRITNAPVVFEYD